MKVTKKIEELTHELSSQIYKDFENIVNINSFTSNIEGNKKVAKMLVDIAARHDVKLDTIFSSKKVRPHLMYQQSLRDDYCAIIGHFDTVHLPDSGFDKMIYKDDYIIGPGTNDMKSGVIIALYSLIILRKIYKDRLPLKILFNSDEEVGSIDSQEIIQNEFKNAKAGFVFEPGRVNQYAIITGRKGICNIDLKVTGKPAHSGVAPWEGVNAIVAMSKIVQELDLLNDYENGSTVGCNEIKGGIAANIVAPFSEVKIDVRFSTQVQGEKLIEDIKNIFAKYNKNGIKVEYDILHKRPPFEENSGSYKLYEEYKKASEFYNVKCTQASTGGVSDANFLASMGIPVIDGIGAFGNYSHTQKEYILKDSLIYKIKIFTLFFINYLNTHHVKESIK